MILLFSGVVAVLFGTGAFLMLKADLFRVVVGMVMISNAAILTLIGSGLSRGAAPIHPLPDERISDPLVQAMALTAIVIGLAVTALLLVLVLRVVHAFRSRELDELAEKEAERDARLERQEAREHDDEEAAAR